MDESTQNGLKEIVSRLDKLQNQIDDLRVRRIHSHDILPNEVKSFHISEGVKFVRGGTAAKKPTAGDPTEYGNAIYFDTTNNKLWIWNDISKTWKSSTLS